MTFDDQIFATLASLDAEPMTPARQGASPVAVAAAVGVPLCPGGPVQATRFAPGEELTPSSAVVALSGATARESTAANGAGADVPAGKGRGDGRVVGAHGAATFALPIFTVPSFDNGPLRPPLPGEPPPQPQPQPGPTTPPPPPA